MSPRLMGEAAYRLGAAGRYGRNAVGPLGGAIGSLPLRPMGAGRVPVWAQSVHRDEHRAAVTISVQVKVDAPVRRLRYAFDSVKQIGVVV